MPNFKSSNHDRDIEQKYLLPLSLLLLLWHFTIVHFAIHGLQHHELPQGLKPDKAIGGLIIAIDLC